MTLIAICVFDEITVTEPDFFEIVVIGLADLRSLFSVIEALAGGVVQYAQGQGLINTTGE